MRYLTFGLSGLLLGACALNTEGDPVAQNDQDIVRGHETNKYPQVVAVRINRFSGWTLCSGTYVSERVVVTAAHCIPFDAIRGQAFVYFGDDYLTDVETDIPNIPPPGERSKWARIETITVNAAYDRELNHPDLAVLYLDRALPFAPIPLLRPRVGSSTTEGTIVGWGGSKALVPDITVVEGAGIKRSAKVRILGSPTEADYHPDDPNPGILVPEIRDHLLKTDGRDPRPNSCAGDSGGPILVKKGGKEYMGGVSMWTGLSCEDYSIYTRVDPFLDFFDSQIDKAGKEDIIPNLECVEELGGGNLRAHFGYVNSNNLTVEIPYGHRNDFGADRHHERPNHFAPGGSPYDFSVDFRSGQRLTWRLNPRSGPATVVRADASSPRCAPNDPLIICASMCDARLGAECADVGTTHGQCVQDCGASASYYGDYLGCLDPWNSYAACVGGLSSDASNWDCSQPGFPPFPAPPNCEAEVNGLLECLGYI
jgi:hypothetical protein